MRSVTILIAFVIVSFPAFSQSSCASSVTGQQEISLPQFDQLFEKTIAASSIPGATFALASNGRLIYARGYGCANTSSNLAIQPDSLMRVASVSKTFTAIGILQMLQAGKLSLSDPVFTKWLTNFQPLAGQQIDPQVKLVTIQELLEHTGGWDRNVTHSYQGKTYSEPVDIANYIATQEGVGEPGTCQDVISAFLSVPLDHAPGTVYAYSDFGYCVLGRVLEAVSGMGYEQYVQQNILKPLGIGRQKLTATMMSDTVNGEVTYYDIPGAALVQSIFPFVTGKVARPYGEKFLETLDSSGGWVANAVDLVRFVEGIDGRHGGPLLSTATVKLMTTYTAAQGFTTSSYYGLGFNMAPNGTGIRWTKDGANAGVASYLTHSPSGFSWAFILNSDPDYGAAGATEDLGPGTVTTLVNAIEDMLSSVTAPSTGDLYPQYASTLLTPAVTSVVQGATYQTQPGIVPGSWVTIFGTNLATATRTFWADEIIGNALPTEIDHVLVTIDGKNAPVYFVSPGQLDVQAPADTNTGAVKVTVTRDGTVSAAGTATIAASSPGFFTYAGSNGTEYVAAEHVSGAVIGNTAATPGTTAAKVGETVELYATGLGDSVAGQLLPVPVALTTLPTLKIGGVAAAVTYAGVISPGLFQINAVIPQVATGDQAIVVTYGGAVSPGSVMISVAAN
jgi:N-acyl-D-amino-acid deacylase